MDTERTFTKAVAAELRGEAAAQGITHATLSKLSGVPKVSVQRYLAGERDFPMAAFYRLVEALSVDPAELMAAAVRRMERLEDTPASGADSESA